MSKTTVLKFGWWGRAQKNCLGPIFQQMWMLLDFFHVHGTRHRWWTKILLRMKNKLAVELERNKPKPVWAHWMTGVSRIEFYTPTSNTGLKNGVCTFIARISLGGMPPSRHGTSTSCWCCFQLLIWVHWRALFCHVQEVPGFQQTWQSIDHTTHELASDDMHDGHTSRTNGVILQGSLGRAASKRWL